MRAKFQRCDGDLTGLRKVRIGDHGGRCDEEGKSARMKKGKKEDNAGTHDFDRTVEMSCISAASSKSNGD